MNIYTVGQINAYIKNMFSQDYFLHSVIVSGEVSNLKYHSSGHIYFTMKDESGVLSAVMFRSNAERLSWKLQNGDRIEAAGSVGTYERSGSYQLYVTSVQKAGAGAMHEELIRLKKKLSEMGMFDRSYKRPVPKYCFRIGVVTSPTGSVIHDIRQVAYRRNPGAEIILRAAKVQGDGAAQSIISGIRSLAKENVDVIIIGRGGGSDEDLYAFNDEELANEIFNCPVPVISAVGHGDDESITDMVADVHAPTPSAAAELAVFVFDDLVRDVNMRMISLESLMKNHIESAYALLRERTLSMKTHSPEARARMQRMSYENRVERIETLMARKLDMAKHLMMLYVEKYKALSPLEKIGHGFAAVTDGSGKKITDIDSINRGDTLRLVMREGIVEAAVLRTEKRKPYDA